MSITAGAWKFGVYQWAPGVNMFSATAAQVRDLVNGILNLITGAGEGWSLTGGIAATTYTFGSAACAYGIARHTAGDAIVIACGPNNSIGNNGIHSSLIEGGEDREIVSVAFVPAAAAAAGFSGNPSSASFFGDARAFRFSHIARNLQTSTVPHNYRVAVQGRNVWITMQLTGAAATAWYSPILMGAHIIEETVEEASSGVPDTATAAQIRWGASNGTLTLASPVAQILNATGAARQSGYTLTHLSALLSATVQTAGPWFHTDFWVLRDAADLATTGVVNGRGIKGRVARYAALAGGTSIANKARLGDTNATHVHLHSGLLLGFNSTYGAMP
jgi:hypothetical protein